MESDKPPYIKLKHREFKTPAHRAAAEDILEHWGDGTYTFAEIARRTDWSESMIQQIFHEYFEPADEDEAENRRTSWDAGDPDSLPDRWKEVYREGYREGFQDGFEAASDE